MVYLSEKEKKEKEATEIEQKKRTSVIERSSVIKSTKIKSDQKEKEKSKEKDVWSFLDTESKKEESEINSKNQDSFEKVHCKSPQARQKKTNDFSKKKKTKKIYDNLFSLEEPTPKHKKTFNKKKRKSINKTTVKRDVTRKYKKKVNQNQILNLQPVEKGDENSDKKEENKNKEKDIISSLEFSDLEDGMNIKDTYKKKNYKTYQNKNKEKNNTNESKSENSSDIKSKSSNNYG
jgi:hypothetical protein